MQKPYPVYLTTSDLQTRWHCKYSFANAFMHRKGIKAIKIGRRLLVDEKQVVAFEMQHLVRKDS